MSKSSKTNVKRAFKYKKSAQEFVDNVEDYSSTLKNDNKDYINRFNNEYYQNWTCGEDRIHPPEFSKSLNQDDYARRSDILSRNIQVTGTVEEGNEYTTIIDEFHGASEPNCKLVEMLKRYSLKSAQEFVVRDIGYFIEASSEVKSLLNQALTDLRKIYVLSRRQGEAKVAALNIAEMKGELAMELISSIGESAKDVTKGVQRLLLDLERLNTLDKSMVRAERRA